MRSIIYSLQQREVQREMLVFAFVITACIFIIVVLCQTMPINKRSIDLVMQSIFSALMAVPAGASWRSLRHAISRSRQLRALGENAQEASSLS